MNSNNQCKSAWNLWTLNLVVLRSLPELTIPISESDFNNVFVNVGGIYSVPINLKHVKKKLNLRNMESKLFHWRKIQAKDVKNAISKLG